MTQIQFNFTLEAEDPGSQARAGSFITPHGKTLTPVFMPVATHAILRGIESRTVRELGYSTLLANTYHLLLRPGKEVFQRFGGIHNFMGWTDSILTDSGGFQVFSLSGNSEIKEEGVTFRSYTDGRYISLSPEESISMQKTIGSDIMMVLDQCIPALSDERTASEAVKLTSRWARRSFLARGDSSQALFAIVQGACFPDLRKESASDLTQTDFDGFAIGGVAVGEDKRKRDEIIAFTAELLPETKPRYVMGIGTPLDLLEAVRSGADMFDCILPASLGQQGVCYTSEGKIDLRKGIYKLSDARLDSACSCQTCQSYSRAYLHHLIKCGEFIGGAFVAYHNLYFYKRLVESMRNAIVNGSFSRFYQEQSQALEETTLIPG